MKEEKKIWKNAALLAGGGLIAKGVGALYRVPLLRVLGSYGVGLYQMVFPVYSLLLTLSASGVPTAVSKLTAEERGEEREKILLAAESVLPVLGLFLSLLLAAFSGVIAKLQGNGEAALCYLAISPSVFFVAAFSAVRGYFQGKTNVIPTAVSQILEQVGKLVFGLTFAFLFLPDPVRAAFGAALGVTAGEGLALFYLFLRLAAERRKTPRVRLKRTERKPLIKKVFALLLPMTVVSVLPVLAGVFTGFFTIPLLSLYTENATAAYGVYFGGVTALVSLPVALCYGIAVSVLPVLSKRRKEGADTAESVKRSYFYTFALSFFAAVMLFFFRGEIVALLYPGLSAEETALFSDLLLYAAWTVPVSALLQTANAVMIAEGKVRRLAVHLGAGCFLETALGYSLLFLGVGIISLPVAAFFGNMVATALNLFYNRKESGLSLRFFGKAFGAAAVSLLSAWLGKTLARGFSPLAALTVGGIAASACFIAFAAAKGEALRRKRT